MSQLSREERETIISYGCDDKVTVYTCQRELWTRLGRIEGFKLIRTERLDGVICSREFECPKSFVRPSERGIMIVAPMKISKKKREQGRRLGLEGHTRSE